MVFAKKNADIIPINDGIFRLGALANEAKEKYGKENVVNATVGTLYDEDGNFVALKSVFDSYDSIDDKMKAQYALSFSGNESYRKQIYNWVLGKTNISMPSTVIATTGGTGAVAMVLQSCLNENDVFLFPELAWGSYKLMTQQFSLDARTYPLFKDDAFDMDSFKQICLNISQKRQKLTLVINDPCHNPTGYSLTTQEWETIISILNECSTYGPVILINDVAYIDYSFNLEHVHNYMNTFNNISDNIAIVIAFSCSKTCTSYGLRIGAGIALTKKEENLKELEVVFEKMARSTWSNIPNAGMENFVRVTVDNLEDFEKEKGKYIDLLRTRSDIFIKEATEVGLPFYPFKEGFFVTIKIDSNEKAQKYHELLIENLIYTVLVDKGIRVGICSISVEDSKGLAKKMKDIYDKI